MVQECISIGFEPGIARFEDPIVGMGAPWDFRLVEQERN
jgi:hypothetical protein